MRRRRGGCRGCVVTLAVLVAGALWVRHAAPGWRDTWDLQVTRLDVPVPGLPAELDGMTVGHITDLHAGNDVPDAFVRKALQAVADARPDMIVLTGDYISYDWRNLLRIQRDLARLRPRLGVYACLGNHDVYVGRQRHITEILEQAGVHVLVNSALPFPGRRDAWVVGLGDPVTEQQDFAAALDKVPPASFKLLLAHSSDVLDAAADLGVDLVLAGHTHGGQVSLPLIGPPIVPTKGGPKYAWGLFDCRGTRLFVNRGVGVVNPCVRLCCPPEVAILRLRKADWKLSEGRWGLDLRGPAEWLHERSQQVRKLVPGFSVTE